MLSFPYLWDEGSLPEPIEIVTWADGSDEDIVAMVEAADRGDIELTDYWSVGDERTVSLAAMAASGTNDYGSWSVDETHAAQDVTLVLMNEGYPVNGVDNSHVNFVVGLKNCLNETGYMKYPESNSDGWKSCARRDWCNNAFYNSIPESIKSIFKFFYTKGAAGGKTSLIYITQDYFALFAEKEIQGDRHYSTVAEANVLSQISYYTTSSNKIKRVKGTTSDWLTRSPVEDSGTAYCVTTTGGGYNTINSNYGKGLAPFGCI